MLNFLTFGLFKSVAPPRATSYFYLSDSELYADLAVVSIAIHNSEINFCFESGAEPTQKQFWLYRLSSAYAPISRRHIDAPVEYEKVVKDFKTFVSTATFYELLVLDSEKYKQFALKVENIWWKNKSYKEDIIDLMAFITQHSIKNLADLLPVENLVDSSPAISIASDNGNQLRCRFG